MSRITWVSALLALTAGSAVAADLPARKGPVAAYIPPAFSWTGFYAGLNAGYAFEANSDARTIGTPGFVGLIPAGVVPGSLKVGGDGFVGGAQIGYNVQFNQIVLGAEADIQALDSERRSSFIGNPVLGTQLLTTASSRLEYLGTVRARIGFTPIDRMLVYATGGLAYGEVKSSASVSGVQAPVLNWQGDSSDMSVGWTVGGGLEYAITNNWTLKAEYLYYELGKETVRTVANAAAAAVVPGVAYDARVETKGQLIRAGINYKFDLPRSRRLRIGGGTPAADRCLLVRQQLGGAVVRPRLGAVGETPLQRFPSHAPREPTSLDTKYGLYTVGITRAALALRGPKNLARVT